MSTEVRLAPLRPEDVDDRYVGWFGDPELMRYYSGSGRRFDRAALLAEAAGETGATAIFAVSVGADPRVVGTVKLGAVDPVHRTADLVALIAEPTVRGRGVGAAAVAQASRVACQRYGVRKLVSGMFAANLASVRAYQRAGWTIEGRLPEHYLVDGEPMDRVLVGCFGPAEITVSAPRALLLDFDGTLVDTLGALRGVLVDFLRGRGVAPTGTEFDTFNGVPIADMLVTLAARHGWPEPADQLLADYWSRLGAVYAAATPIPGAEQLLVLARRAGWPVAIVTSGRQGPVRGWLARHGLEHHVDAVIGSEDVPAAKPDPAPFLAGAAALEVAPADCLAVEDSLVGAASARAAGAQVVVVNPAGRRRDLAALVTGLEAVLEPAW